MTMLCPSFNSRLLVKIINYWYKILQNIFNAQIRLYYVAKLIDDVRAYGSANPS